MENAKQKMSPDESSTASIGRIISHFEGAHIFLVNKFRKYHMAVKMMFDAQRDLHQSTVSSTLYEPERRGRPLKLVDEDIDRMKEIILIVGSPTLDRAESNRRL